MELFKESKLNPNLLSVNTEKMKRIYENECSTIQWRLTYNLAVNLFRLQKFDEYANIMLITCENMLIIVK